ncbi:sialic acid-specific 9-O-acetylesterase [Lentisphaera araneosa HTCC2155]|uniref:Sialic acid-specific 9-O-acetylesterase n=1 Tax=Lentisphaera araneosa HTCC2155 TaxID=313628 RepID=A6DS94_9BACT|nr:sialate O-acetylesterase [Lentisphaera araneosa]EDM25439.1 sialic acid-specific 9-O-acetylesterase [Lentisphaera araneosa HTCC2155]
MTIKLYQLRDMDLVTKGKRIKIFFITLCFASSIVFAEIKIATIFSDGAVLQCEKPLPIWGWGKAGEEVKVSFAGQSQKTIVDAKGNWQLKLKAVKGSYKPYSMVVQSENSRIVIRNIVVGEVWFCSGQSNMMYTLEMLSLKTKDVGYESVLKFMKDEKEQAKDEFLRQIKVPNVASALETKKDFEGQWLASTPQNNGSFSGTAYFFAKQLRQHLDRPVGIVNVTWGGKRIESFIPPSEFNQAIHKQLLTKIQKQVKSYDAQLASKKYQQAMVKYREAIKLNRKKGLPRPKRPIMSVVPSANSATPASIFNGMVNPVIPYAIRGAIWYQGESHNPNRVEAHRGLLKSLIRGWRAKWQQGNFPVYFCQLANLGESLKEPLQKKNTWVEISNQLRLGLEISNTGMAVLHDIGQVKDIHPVNKVDVGKRLSRWALHDTYQINNIVPSGPLFQSAERKGATVIVHFNYSESGLIVGKKQLLEPVKPVERKLSGFELCGEDGVWKYATAKIINPNQVLLSHKDIVKPRGVRYAWQQNPANANLYNKAGLPTAIFSTTKVSSK